MEGGGGLVSASEKNVPIVLSVPIFAPLCVFLISFLEGWQSASQALAGFTLLHGVIQQRAFFAAMQSTVHSPPPEATGIP